MTSYIPESAPFSEEQRAWLNGFFAGLTGMPGDTASAAAEAAGAALGGLAVGEEEEDFPWHDPSLPIVDRMELAEGKPLDRKLMAAMAQLDCGSCGYLCQTYSEAIASGAESNLTLCSPGGKETKQMIKRLLAEQPDRTEASMQAAAPLSESGWSRQRPYTATLRESRRLNGEGSNKDTRHVVIELGDSGLTYNVGDALGIYPVNERGLVDAIIVHFQLSPSYELQMPSGGTKTLVSALREDFCLKDPSDELLTMLSSRAVDPGVLEELQRFLDDGVPEGIDVLDVLHLAADAALDVASFIATLEPLNPRLYSIASSMRQVGNEVHLTVGKVSYERGGRMRHGVASTMLADGLEAGDSVRVFVQPNHGGFTVPADPAAATIMVGPGTGIAPFIAFLQERAAVNATGKNWLFFGDQRRACDFLYEPELAAFQQSGVLTHLDTAFSRDQEEKVYVQDRLRERAEAIFEWLEAGASFYVCGDAARMAADVDRTLHEIIEVAGGRSAAEAAAYVRQLVEAKRYLRDVY